MVHVFYFLNLQCLLNKYSAKGGRYSRRPVGRPKKTWSTIEEEDIKLNITKDMAEQRIKNSGGNSYHLQRQEGEH